MVDKDNVLYVDFVQKKRIAKPEVLLQQPNQFELERYRHFVDCYESGIVSTILNGAHASVKLPAAFKVNGVKINWSKKYGIADFSVDRFGVRGTLSFSGQPSFVEIPWKQVHSIFVLNAEQDTLRDWEVSDG